MLVCDADYRGLEAACNAGFGSPGLAVRNRRCAVTDYCQCGQLNTHALHVERALRSLSDPADTCTYNCCHHETPCTRHNAHGYAFGCACAVSAPHHTNTDRHKQCVSGARTPRTRTGFANAERGAPERKNKFMQSMSSMLYQRSTPAATPGEQTRAQDVISHTVRRAEAAPNQHPPPKESKRAIKGPSRCPLAHTPWPTGPDTTGPRATMAYH